MKKQIYFAALFIITSWIIPISNFAQVQVGSNLMAESEMDHFGSAVSISSDGLTIAVGGPENDVDGTGYGHVRIYEWKSEDWEQKGEDLDGTSTDRLGVSISLSEDGQRIAVGGPLNQDAGAFSGQVRVYSWQNDEWSLLGQPINGENNGDNAGMSVSLSADGTRVAVGAPNDDSNGNNAGSVKVFSYDAINNSWNQLGSDLLGENADDKVGYSLDLSPNADYLATGALGSGSEGKVSIYHWENNSWNQMGDEIQGETGSIQLGKTLSISENGNRIAVGIPFFPFEGAVRVYDYDNGSWVLAGQEIIGENLLDNFGISVDLSSDGNRLIVGAPNNSYSGTATIYDFINQQWEPVGDIIEGDLAGDEFGKAVVMTPDGNRFIIGAPKNDDAGNNSGQAKVFEFANTSSSSIIDELECEIHPNPTSGHLFFRHIDPVRIVIYNLSGIEMMQIKPGNPGFNISSLPSGTYFVRVFCERGTALKKIVKIAG